MAHPNDSTIHWRLHLRSPPAAVYELLATDTGRRRFWALEAEEREGTIRFRFPNGQRLTSRILAAEPARRFAVAYFGGSEATFELAAAPDGGTDLSLTERLVPPGEREANRPGWVAVLLALKAAADFGVDLRNHDPERTWDRGFVDG